MDFYKWWKEIYSEDYKRDLTISLLNEKHESVITWKLKNAWPKKVKSTDLKASANEVAIETMD
jgi:phage tail-like protein